MTPTVPRDSNGYNACEVGETFDNTKQTVIKITQDKLENVLLKHGRRMDNRFKWIEPLALLCTIIVAQTTAEFHNQWGITKNAWEGLFFVLALLSFVWLVYAIIRAFNSLTAEELATKIRTPNQ
jgi:hypothetical protein